MNKKPNIIIFNPDQMRADSLHHLGNPASITPTLDQMAAARFCIISQCFLSESSLCSQPMQLYDRTLSPCPWTPDHGTSSSR